MKRQNLLLCFLFLAFVGDALAVKAPSTQVYDQSAEELITRTKRKHGTEEQEAALGGAIDKRTDKSGKTLVSDQDKANSPFAMVANVNAQQKTCSKTRSIEVVTAKNLMEMSGRFRIRGNDFWTDIKTCLIKVSYDPYKVTVQLPAKVETASGGWSGTRPTYRGSYDGDWSYKYSGGACGGGGDCNAKTARSLLSCPNPGNLTYSSALVSQRYTGRLLSGVTYQVDAKCRTPQSETQWRLNRVVTNQCGALARCTELGNSTDGYSCQTIKGIRVCEPWWNKTVEYACGRNYECSAFPESEEVCGPWFSNNMTGCVNSAETGVWAMALQKFRGLVGNMNCNPFKVDDLGAVGIPGGSRFANGCGVFQPSRTDLFRLNGSDHRLINARCLSSPATLPPTLLKEITTYEANPGGITSTIKTFDYYIEGVKDSCTKMISDMQAKKITCRMLTETTDGTATFINGNRMASPAGTAKVFDGQLGSYSFSRPFWQVEQTWYCPIDPQKANPKPGKHELAKPNVTESGSTDSPGFAEGLGSLGVATELAKSISGDTGCSAPKPDGTCDPANVELFPGKKESCKLDSPDLTLVGYTCCKANLKAACGPGSGMLCADFCNQDDVNVSENVYNKKVDALAGEYCSDLRCTVGPLSPVPAPTVNGKCMGVWSCFQKRKTYCNFNSILARLLQQQGRSQLGFGFGSGESPSCRGLTLDEFQQLDFKKMDLGEFYDTLQMEPSGIQEVDPASIQNTIINGVKNANK